MQLKLRRSQREGGVLSHSVIFCLDARVEFTPQERESIARHKLHNEVIYNSEASKRMMERGDAHRDGSTRGALKSLAYTALAAMRLNITIASLARGQHVECKSLDELLGAEEAIMTACRNLKGYLDTAATFDGREVLIDFETDEPQIVAHVAPPAIAIHDASPQPALIIEPSAPLPDDSASAVVAFITDDPPYGASNHSLHLLGRRIRALFPEGQLGVSQMVLMGVALFVLFSVLLLNTCS